ncbi:6,7-dimethyl-8-ribityllumazine synthase [Candidatus Johnevansia muelleri]|uniref:6,7-dimethyl-8-ribityllumazine synthase n=1 Tax=Candidatus Johnevansia muelleri TaxID=1495769 RepID=A0A078KHM9_9GAMM|nr:6,7-dimethyl-8-ribityllumazine synthase [Candidatus Evansia muelleri]
MYNRIDNIFEGQLFDVNGRYVIVSGRVNYFIVENLIKGAINSLLIHGVDKKNIYIIYVPGAWEFPIVIKRILEILKPDAIIAIGAIIIGDTPHFEQIYSQCNSAINSLQLIFDTPITNGVLTVNTIEQAIERSGTKIINKGIEAAIAAMEMVSLLRKLSIT